VVGNFYKQAAFSQSMSTMMQSVALNESTIYPNDDEEYVVVEIDVEGPLSHADTLNVIMDDDDDEEEYDYCDDIVDFSGGNPTQDCLLLQLQSTSFEEVSDHFSEVPQFSFAEEASQLLSEIDESESFLQEMPDSEDFPTDPIISSTPADYDHSSHPSMLEEKNAVSPTTMHHHEYPQPDAVDSEETKKPAAPSTSGSQQEHKKQEKPSSKPDHMEPQGAAASGTKGSRMTNKKRRKQMKLAKKAAAAAAAAASLSHLSMSHHSQQHDVGSNSLSHPSRRNNATAANAAARGKQSNNIAVACATQSLAEYRIELQSHHHRNTTGTTTTNKLVR